MQSNEFMVML